MQESFSVGRFLGILFKRRKALVIGTCLCALLSAVVSLTLIPKQFVSGATLMPPEGEETSSLGILLGRSGLPLPASLFGGSQSTELLREVLLSHKVLSAVVDQLDLYAPYDLDDARAEDPHAALLDAVAILRERIQIEIAPESGVLHLAASARTPALSKQLVDAMLSEAERFTRESARTLAARKLAFLEERLALADEDLEGARQAILDFSEAEGVIHLPSELEAELSLVAELNRRLILKRLEHAVAAQDAAPDSPALRRLLTEISVLETQLREMEEGTRNSALRFLPLKDLPGLGLRYYRLQRDLAVQQELVNFLTQQAEQSRFRAADDTPRLRVLDAPIEPSLAAWPRKKLIVVVSTLLGGLLTAIGVLADEFRREVIENRNERWSDWSWLAGRRKA